ncbi:MAG TPA: CHAD domain-containing protein [Steroidobacteraceae bacterium]|jgi:CHAD domain-containing protein|nr:CHAD domain-containing protein [Steroidobacteraceae bacterium]
MSSNNYAAKHEVPGQKDGREVEWQLASTDLGSVRRWLADHGTIDGLVLEPRSTLQIFDTYLDTDDWRIHRAGFALRIRSESGKSEATLKSLHSTGAEVADRRELSEILDGSESESIRQSIGPVGTRVHAVSGARALLPLFEVRTSRQRFAIRRIDESQQLGEIALDDTVISRPHGEPQTSMQRVEVEVLAASHEPLRLLVQTLRNDCALEAACDTKYSQGLKSVGLAPGPAREFAPTAVEASMPMAEVALANLRRYWSAWYLHEPGARLGDNPEELHDLRVAARRSDAILRQFRSSLPVRFVRIRPTLKKILRALGSTRDLDVALSELESFSRKLPESDRASAEPLKQYLVSERCRARGRMLSVLDSVSVQTDLKVLTSLLAAPSATAPQSPPQLALNIAPEFIRRRYRKVRKGADLLTSDSPMEAYHEVRGRVKRLRYALEAVAAIYGKPAEQMLRALCRWQEKLGVQQDAIVASRRLKALAGAPPKSLPPETLFLMGRLAGHYSGAASRARKLHAKAYRKVRRKWKRLRMMLEYSAVNDAPKLPGSGP